jgi:prevent-host-death family protein
MKNIRPSSDIRNHYQEISKQAKAQRKPIYITVNGVGDTVILNQQVYEELEAELELLRLLAEGEADLGKGQLHEGKKTFESLLASNKKR